MPWQSPATTAYEMYVDLQTQVSFSTHATCFSASTPGRRQEPAVDTAKDIKLIGCTSRTPYKGGKIVDLGGTKTQSLCLDLTSPFWS